MESEFERDDLEAQCKREVLHQDECKRKREAAEKGDANAQYQLGMSYQFGFEVAKDYQLAAEWRDTDNKIRSRCTWCSSQSGGNLLSEIMLLLWVHIQWILHQSVACHTISRQTDKGTQ